jgi:hypothetical protein
MKKTIFLLTAILFSVIVSAQVDLSGTWVLNKTKSKLGAEFSMAPKDMTVTQKGNDLSFEKHSEWQGQEFTISDKFTLDGKECVNAGMMDTEKKSTAVWSDDKKSLKITSKVPIQGETMTIIEVYKMDGGNLVLESKASSSYGDMEETQVFDKK